MKDIYVELAKKTIELFVKTGKMITKLRGLPRELIDRKAGVFVSIHQRDGSLRGCIGTFLPARQTLAEEIIRNAIAASRDPRFPLLSKSELPNLVYSVDILSEPRTAKKEEIDPKKYGLLVMTPDGRKGLLLPDLPGVETADQQIEICKRKAGIKPGQMVSYKIFTVERHGKHHG